MGAAENITAALGEASVLEASRVYTWNTERMVSLGLRIYQAERLCDAGVSWHSVEELVRGGASPGEAYRVLR